MVSRRIGKAILENWNFAESMAHAVGQEDFARTDGDPPDLTDVVGVAVLMVSYGTNIAGLERRIARPSGREAARLEPNRRHWR